MGIEQVKKHLEELQKELPRKDILSAVFKMLDNNPQQDIRELLEIWLMMYVVFDIERVALYWKPFLYYDDYASKLKAMNRLYIISKHNQLAHKILYEYLGEEPNEESMKRKYQSFFNQATGKSLDTDGSDPL